MVLDAVSNFVRGNTDAEVGTDDTTVSVADASIFPDPATDGEFNVVIWDVNNFPRPDQDGDVEILRVTERDTTDDELTVTRGQEMTSAAAHPEGSAIHLSPTAKMFTDIEGTFTTEAEAADAAPVQSVFDRVGDVVAETGDYAATQITNFGSEVLSSIDGSSISPSDITDLWDGSVVTADVDNESVNTESLDIANVFETAVDDSELDDFLSGATDGDSVYLANTTYSKERTGSDAIDSIVSIVGTAGATRGSQMGADWTADDRIRIESLRIRDQTLTLNGRFSEAIGVEMSSDGEIVVDADDVLLTVVNGGGGTITFNSETENGAVGVKNGETFVADNGNNEVLSG